MKPARLLLSLTGLVAVSLAGYFLMAEASPEQLTDLRDDYRFAFARSQDDQKVVAIDTHSQTKAAEIDFPHKVGDIIVSKMLDMLFVNDPENNSVTPVFLKDLTLAPGFEIGFTPVDSILGPEGQFAAFVGANGELVVWDLENIHPIYQNAGFQPGAKFAFSASGHDILVVEGERNRLLAVNLEKGRIVGVADLTLNEGTNDISAVTRSLDGHTGFVAVGADQIARLEALAAPLRVFDGFHRGDEPVNRFFVDLVDGLTIVDAEHAVRNADHLLQLRVVQADLATLARGILRHQRPEFLGIVLAHREIRAIAKPHVVAPGICQPPVPVPGLKGGGKVLDRTFACIRPDHGLDTCRPQKQRDEGHPGTTFCGVSSAFTTVMKFGLICPLSGAAGLPLGR